MAIRFESDDKLTHSGGGHWHISRYILYHLINYLAIMQIVPINQIKPNPRNPRTIRDGGRVSKFTHFLPLKGVYFAGKKHVI